MGHSYFGIHTLRADADPFHQTPISKHIRGLGTPGDRVCTQHLMAELGCLCKGLRARAQESISSALPS